MSTPTINDDSLPGTSSSDTIDGLSGNDIIQGFDGDDTLIGNLGNDVIDGGADNDSITGDEGTDTIDGGDGDDTIDGGTEADSILGGNGADSILGGAGNDTIGNFSVDGDDDIDGGDGDDRIWDYYGQNTVQGGEGNDDIDASGPSIDGGAGDDNIFVYRDFSGGDSAMEIAGGEGNDTIGTSNFANSINFLGLTIDGGTGDDRITGSNLTNGAPELLIGGDGNDTVYGGSGDDSIEGNADNDSLFGGAGNDTIDGGAGDDTIEGDGGDDLIVGGDTGETSGDIYSSPGNRDRYALIDGGAGAIIIVDRTGAEGSDTLTGIETLRFADGDVSVATLGLGVAVTGTNPAGETLTGTEFDDFITGLGGGDTINGLDGSDVIDGGDGDNIVDGGDGADNITTGAGADDITAGAGADVVNAGDGDDTIDGGTDADTLYGGNGADSILGGAGNDTIGNFSVDGDDDIDGGDGDDRIADYYGQNTVQGGDGNDDIDASGPSIDGGAGDDNILVYRDFSGGDSAMEVAGGAGNDTIGASNFANSINFLGLTIDGGTGDDRITGSGITNGAPELLMGGDGNDTVYGGSGDDTVEGNADNDSLFGGAGNDDIDGGSGDDIIEGDSGDDVIDGGTEATDDGDIAVYNRARGDFSVIGDASGLTVVDNVGNDGTDTLINIERLRFTDGDVIVATGLVGATIVGTEFDDDGLPGNPGALTGTILNDSISGLEGDDVINGLGGIDSIDGGSGDDTIDAGAQDDIVAAGSGDDTVTGGEGDDDIDMGDGFDVAVFAGVQADYSIVGDQTSVVVTDLDAVTDGDDGTDTIQGARILRFSDGDVLLNAAPTPDAESYTTDEDNAITIPLADLLAGDTDADGDPLSIVRVENPQNGFVSIVGTDVIFTPDANYNGPAGFDYVVSDTLEEVVQTVSVTVDSVNDDPNAVTDSFTLDEDTSQDFDVLANDTDVDGDSLSVSIVSGPSSGTASVNGDNTINFAPDPDFSGVVTLIYEVDDGNGGTDQATAIFTVAEVNDAPVAVSDSYSTGFETTLSIIASGVLANDTDPESDPLTTVLDTGPANGELTLNADGSFEYTPDEGFVGLDSFTYFANDGTSSSATAATVTINVEGAGNAAPVAVDDAFSTDANAQLLGNVLDANPVTPDSDADGDTITVLSVTDSDGTTRTADGSRIILPTGAWLFINDDGTFEYEPMGWTFSGGHETDTIFDVLAQGEIATETFSYTITDGNGEVATADVEITVTGQNDAPVAIIDEYELTEDETVSGNALTDGVIVGPDFDPDTGDSITLTKVNGMLLADADEDAGTAGTQITIGSGGLLTIFANGDFTFETSGAYEFLGDDFATAGHIVSQLQSVTYTIADTAGLEDSNSLRFSVQGVNDAPEAEDDTAETEAETAININVLSNDTDAEGDDLEVVEATSDDGTVVIEADGSLTFTPNLGFFGDATIDYEIEDEVGAKGQATVTVRVNAAANTPPVANDDAETTNEDTSVYVDLLGNDLEDDGDPLEVTFLGDPSNGSVEFDGEGYLYTPDQDFNGTDSFMYEVSDGQGGVDTATVTITVDPVNDAPVANDSAATIAEDGSSNFGILALISDVDGDALSIASLSVTGGATVAVTSDTSFSVTGDPDFNGPVVVTYSVTDGELTSNEATVDITFSAVNDAPVLDAAGPFLVDENTTDVGTISASDVDSSGLTFSIVGGADAALFGIDGASGEITFNAAPDFEAPGDDDGDNRYEVQVSVTDGELSDDAFIFIDVQDVDEGVTPNFIQGTDAPFEQLVGTDGVDVISTGGGNFDFVTGGGGSDTFVIEQANDGLRQMVNIADFEIGTDMLDLNGRDIAFNYSLGSTTYLLLSNDFDTIVVNGASSLDDISFA